MRPDRTIHATRPRLSRAPRARARRLVWEAAFRERLARGDPVGAADALVERAPKRKGQPGVLGAHSAVATRLLDVAPPSPLVRREWALRLAIQPSSTHRTLAASLLAGLWPAYPQDVERALEGLAAHDDWVTREDAASAMGAILERHFIAFLPRVRRWLAGPSPRVRRAAVIAVKVAARGRGPDRVERLLDVLEPALRDADPYVRKNLGPFAIGDGLLRAFPEATLARLGRWAALDDPNVRWNVAMSFTSAEARRHRTLARRVLAHLVADERPDVARAVASAKRNLARKG